MKLSYLISHCEILFSHFQSKYFLLLTMFRECSAVTYPTLDAAKRRVIRCDFATEKDVNGMYPLHFTLLSIAICSR